MPGRPPCLLTAMPNESRTLIIFAKKPIPGRVKTRLSPPLPEESAAALYACMLADTLAMAGGLPGVNLCICYQDDPGGGDYFAGLAPEVELFPQRGGDLGERMAAALAERFAGGDGSVAIIGSDSPDLPPGHVLEAFRLLEEGSDAVFGPAEDGGYYLVAMKRVWPELFTSLPWSSPGLLTASLARAGERGIEVGLLPTWSDMDNCADLVMAMESGRLAAAPLTLRFLRERILPTLPGKGEPPAPTS